AEVVGDDVRRRDQRLAHVLARMDVPLQDDHTVSGPPQVSADGSAARATTDHDDIGVELVPPMTVAARHDCIAPLWSDSGHKTPWARVRTSEARRLSRAGTLVLCSRL